MKIWLLFTMLAVAGFTFAGAGGSPDFSIDRYTIDAGGGTSTGGEISLTGTIGQHDASPQSLSGGDFILAGGFWAQPVERLELIFRDSFESE